MIEEDRLLSRIDILENKLQYFQKNITDDKLRKEILKLQDDKSVYQVRKMKYKIYMCSQRKHAIKNFFYRVPPKMHYGKYIKNVKMLYKNCRQLNVLYVVAKMSVLCCVIN